MGPSCKGTSRAGNLCSMEGFMGSVSNCMHHAQHLLPGIVGGLYAKQIEKLTTQWPRCWGLIYLADDAARAKRFEKARRKLTIEAAQGRQVPREWDPLRPWSCIFVQVSLDMQFWSERVHHPAAAWTAAGGRGAPTVASEAAVLEVIQGGSKALSHESEGHLGGSESRRTQSNRDRRAARKRKMAADREELPRHRSTAASQSSKGGPTQKGKGKGKSKDQAGSELCFSWASGKGHCAEVAPGGECKGPVSESTNVGFACHLRTETPTVGQADSRCNLLVSIGKGGGPVHGSQSVIICAQIRRFLSVFLFVFFGIVFK